MTDKELAVARARRAGARATLACEGIYFTAEEEALFDHMEAKRMTHPQREAFLLDYIRATAKSIR